MLSADFPFPAVITGTDDFRAPIYTMVIIANGQIKVKNKAPASGKCPNEKSCQHTILTGLPTCLG